MSKELSSDTNVASELAALHIPGMAEKKKIEALGQRIAVALDIAGLNYSQAAKEFGVTRSSVSQWVSGKTEPTPERLRQLAALANVDLNWLGNGAGTPPDVDALRGMRQDSETLTKITAPSSKSKDSVSNASSLGQPDTIGGAVDLTHKIPVYGQAMGGRDGEFVLNGNKIADILAPPSLMHVKEAYAVYVSGDSMSPRYEAGEAVFVNPKLPVRKDHYVVVQISTGGDDAPHGYVKRFISMDDKTLKLAQFNPKKTLTFPRGKVVSVHRIVMGGEG